MALFPIVDIKDFRESQLTGNRNFSYSEIHGIHHIRQPHVHSFFLILLFERANGLYNIDFNDHKIEDRQIHILFPNQVHSWELGSDTMGYQLLVDKEHFEKFSSTFLYSFAQYQRSPVIKLSDLTFELLSKEFKAIREELQSEDSLAAIVHFRTAVIISILSKEIRRILSDEQMVSYNSRILHLQALIEEHFRSQKSLAFYADNLHISISYLTKLCGKYLHASPAQLILQRTVLEAKRLLKSTDLSVKEIAFDLGFADAPHFSNFFKQHTSMTPKQFRLK